MKLLSWINCLPCETVYQLYSSGKRKFHSDLGAGHPTGGKNAVIQRAFY